jgi:hypothetical protein
MRDSLGSVAGSNCFASPAYQSRRSKPLWRRIRPARSDPIASPAALVLPPQALRRWYRPKKSNSASVITSGGDMAIESRMPRTIKPLAMQISRTT